MSNSPYQKFYTLLMNGGVNLSTANIYAALVSSGYTPNLVSDQYLSVATSSIVARSGPLGASVISGTLGSNTIVFSSVTGATATQLLLYINSGTDATSQLIAVYNQAAGLPVVPSGGNITVTFTPYVLSISPPAGVIATPPSQASGNGYSTLVFDDEFDVFPDIGFAQPGHKWNAGLWWEVLPSPTQFSVSASVLTLTDVTMCTQFHNNGGSTGTSFLGGYFEARLMCTDWSAFWLFCWDRPNVFGTSGYWAVQANAPSTWTSEIDILETDYSYTTSVWNTLHKNTNSDTLPDAQNFPAQTDLGTGFSPFGQWHTYGCLWQNGQVTWYVDNVQTITVADYESTFQPMQLVLTAAPGGVNGSSPSGGTQPPTTMVDWVRVWH